MEIRQYDLLVTLIANQAVIDTHIFIYTHAIHTVELV